MFSFHNVRFFVRKPREIPMPPAEAGPLPPKNWGLHRGSESSASWEAWAGPSVTRLLALTVGDTVSTFLKGNYAEPKREEQAREEWSHRSLAGTEAHFSWRVEETGAPSFRKAAIQQMKEDMGVVLWVKLFRRRRSTRVGRLWKELDDHKRERIRVDFTMSNSRNKINIHWVQWHISVIDIVSHLIRRPALE